MWPRNNLNALYIFSEGVFNSLNRRTDDANNSDSSLSGINSFVEEYKHIKFLRNKKHKIEGQHAIFLDIGGSHMEIVLLKFDFAYLLPQIVTLHQIDYQEELRLLSSEEFLELIAEECYKFLHNLKGNFNYELAMKIPVCLSLSLNCEQLSLSKVKLLKLSKSFCFDDYLNKDLAELINKKFEEKKPKDLACLEINVIMNDAVAVMACYKYLDLECDACVLIGTGINSAILEKSFKRASENERSIINLELGNFGSKEKKIDYYILDCVRNEYDIKLLSQDFDSNNYFLEKLTSGLYISEIIRLALMEKIKSFKVYFSKKCSLTSKEISYFLEKVSECKEKNGNLIDAKTPIEKLYNTLGTEDKDIIKDTIEWVVDRSAGLIAACIIALARHSNNTIKRKRVKIGIQGSIFTKFYMYEQRVKEYVYKLEKKFEGDLEIELINNMECQPILGAALVSFALRL